MENRTLLFFLEHYKEQKYTSNVTFFYSKEYPLLFFSYLFLFLKKHSTFQSIHLSENEWSLVQLTMETTFLGQLRTVWLGNISACDATKKKKFLTFIKNYKGPHRILYFLLKDDVTDTDTTGINLDTNYTQAMIEPLAQNIFGVSKSVLLESLKNIVTQLSLEDIMLLLQYNLVLGNNVDQFKQEWYTKIISPDESLFVLSQYFFAKKKELFYKEWIAIKDSYDQVFWTTFWSEQLWKAYFFKVLKEKNDLSKAKQIGFRLPFSFLQKDWQKHSLESLLQAHALIYEIDIAIKRGSGSAGLDLFYGLFFE